MKGSWQNKDYNNWYDNLDIDKYKTASLSSTYGYKRKNSFLKHLWIKQFFGALILFAVFLVFFSWKSPGVVSIQENVRYLLAEEKSDFTPVLETMVREGLWLDSYDLQVYRSELPMSIPVSGKYVQNFGWVETNSGENKFHPGIDIETEAAAPVRAALDGKISKVSHKQNLGRIIEITHQNNTVTIYGLLGEILVDEGQLVKQGDIIGKTKAGEQGQQVKLHFEVREKGKAIDPLDKITNNQGTI
ncbi:M23 family metallopeptidase [Bacillota bacterium LX-D]|nr:M23 family metallopeptidase [Bacillota bacterium LX-D]